MLIYWKKQRPSSWGKGGSSFGVFNRKWWNGGNVIVPSFKILLLYWGKWKPNRGHEFHRKYMKRKGRITLFLLSFIYHLNSTAAFMIAWYSSLSFMTLSESKVKKKKKSCKYVLYLLNLHKTLNKTKLVKRMSPYFAKSYDLCFYSHLNCSFIINFSRRFQPYHTFIHPKNKVKGLWTYVEQLACIIKKSIYSP